MSVEINSLMPEPTRPVPPVTITIFLADIVALLFLYFSESRREVFISSQGGWGVGVRVVCSLSFKFERMFKKQCLRFNRIRGQDSTSLSALIGYQGREDLFTRTWNALRGILDLHLPRRDKAGGGRGLG